MEPLRVIITRPQAQVGAWRDCLTAAGIASVSVPLLAIEPVSAAAEIQAVKNIVLDFDQYQLAIFVSQNAVTYGGDWLDRYWPELPVGIQYLAVGRVTAAKLRTLGVQVQEAGAAMNSEALLALPALQQVRGQKVVIFRGRGGRPLLGDELQRRGALVDYCELYHRRLPGGAAEQLAATAPGPGDVFSVHSGETLNNLCQLLNAAREPGLFQTPVLVPGDRVATLALEAGFKTVVKADNASDEAMLAALLTWQRSLTDTEEQPN